MITVAKKIGLTSIVLITAWMGISVGRSLTFEIATQVAQASSTPPGDPQEKYKNIELFQKVLHFVETNYVDKDKVKNQELIYGAIKGMLESLDPHSNFLPPQVFKDMKIDTQGKFGGVGIEIGMKDNILTVISPIEDTPAWKAGLKPNDRIVKIDNESTKGLSLMEAVSKMRGKKGSDVNLTIYRQGFEKTKDVKITRDIIKIQSVKSESLEKGYPYVRLSNFNESAAQDIKKALEKYEKEGKIQGLVFDLRNNPGGLLDQAVEVSSLFLDDGVIVSTIGRDPNQKEVKYAVKGNARKDFPVAILVNTASASASEIVAGALQDHKRALIMGQPTFGKGSVQTVIELAPDTGLKLTIARYYTPSGVSIQEKGIQPDIILDDFDSKILAEARKKSDFVREKDLKGHLVNENKEFSSEELNASFEKKKDEADGKKGKDDDLMAPTKLNPKEDYQVQTALNYLKSYGIFKKLAEKEKAALSVSATSGQ